MSWNYRVLVTEHNKEYVYSIHSVYYDKDGNPEGYSKEPSIVMSEEGMSGLSWQLNRMREAIKKPYLWGDEKFPQPFIIEENAETT